jgi:predicted regulator of Ras-like GTPase activity (Roadblock/LC7/MglB family)
MKSYKSHLAENNNSLQVKQLIYTSFCGQGFTLLTSENVPLSVQKSFCKRFVQTFWDPYLPPSSDYRAAYLCQLVRDVQGTLFGWLYHDGYDDIGRSDIPYFIAYYLPGQLPASQLSAILTIIEQGPVSWVDRHEPAMEPTLETLTIKNVRHNKPKRQGVTIPTAIRVQSYEAMQSRVPIDYFFANTSAQDVSLNPDHSQAAQSVQLLASPDGQDVSLEHRLQDSNEQQRDQTDMKSKTCEVILRELVAKPIGINGAVLVSSEGQAVTTPIGIDENSSGMIAGTMIYLAKNTKAALNWHEIELVSMKAPEGYVVLSRCNPETYLLIQSGKVPLGLLEGEISQAVIKIQDVLSAIGEPDADSREMTPQSYLAIGGIADESLSTGSEVTYRGRRTSA